MDVAKKHIINKVFIEVSTSSNKRAYYFKDNIDMFIKEYVLPRLLISFDDLGNNDADHFIQLERLDVELEINFKQDLKGLEEDIAHQITKKIHKLREEKPFKANEKDTLRLLKSEERGFEKFLHFLENGTNSWFNISGELPDFSENSSMFRGEKGIKKLSAVLKNPLTFKRLVLQFTDEDIQKVFNHFVEIKGVKVETPWRENEIKDVISKGNINDEKYTSLGRLLIWDIAFAALLEEKDLSKVSYKFTQLFFETTKRNFEKNRGDIKTYFVELLKQFPVLTVIQNLQQEIQKVSEILDAYQNDIKQSVSQQDDQEILISEIEEEDDTQSAVFKIEQEENPDESSIIDFNFTSQKKIYPDVDERLTVPEDSEDVYVNHAGLILAHPFLSQLFKNCRVIDEQNKFLDKEKAVHILHYIATGKEQQLENNMVFEKFLCNLPSKYPINRFVQLEDDVKNHADKMLTALVEHWEVMKSSSNDLLRNEFLQRSGKLILTEGRPRLILERKTQDILIDKIPWNISMIKLPWKDKIIFVDW